jgi:peroxiredoxin
MPEVLSTFRLQPGGQAPDFSLPDASGRQVTRVDATGPAGLLVVFACNHCPFVIHLAEALGELAREFAAQGVHTVAINPNDADKYPQDGAAHMPAFARQYRWDFPYLIDESQAVARAYGAACTPDFFLLDAAGRVTYMGQFDDTRPRSGMTPYGGDLREAVRRMIAGEQPLVSPYPSSGCSIKWKEGNQPEWWNSGVSSPQ